MGENVDLIYVVGIEDIWINGGKIEVGYIKWN